MDAGPHGRARVTHRSSDSDPVARSAWRSRRGRPSPRRLAAPAAHHRHL